MLTASTSKLSWRLAKHPLTHWHFKGMAFYWALVLERKLLQELVDSYALHVFDVRGVGE
jgi:hypothetical protein